MFCGPIAVQTPNNQYRASGRAGPRGFSASQGNSHPMVDLPLLGGSEDSSNEDPRSGIDVDPLVSCRCQDGTLFVYEDHVHINRTSFSKFADKSIGMEEIGDAEYSGGIVIGYIQIQQTGVEPHEGGRFSSPVDENTLHFGWRQRDCAQDARDAILERAGAT